MSPSVALQSPVFLLYLSLATGLLSTAGITLAVLRQCLRINVRHALAAYVGWLLLVPLLLLVFFLGREAVIVLWAALAACGFREFARATDLERDRLLSGVVYVGIGATALVALISAGGATGTYDAFMALPVFVTAVILAVPVVRDRARGQLRLSSLAILGFLLTGWMPGHVVLLANSPRAYAYLGYLVVAVGVNDVAAYSLGKFLGRHPLRANVSPNKTWEGAAGALAVSLLLPRALRSTLPHFQAMDCVLSGLMVGIGGQVGDLVMSAIKRDLGIKDMSTLIPGHGGILDRIDSLIYVAPLFCHYVRFRFGFEPLP